MSVFDIDLLECQTAGLAMASSVRVHKLETLQKSLVERRLGQSMVWGCPDCKSRILASVPLMANNRLIAIYRVWVAVAQVLLEEIYKSFPARGGGAETTVLRRINLTVQEGEFMVLVGPSGCGKSTLLRLIAGLETLSGGNIWVGERLMNRLPPKQRDIAMVFQSYALYPHMTVYDNLAFGLRRMETGKPRQGRAARGTGFVVEWTVGGVSAVTRLLPRALRYVSPQERSVAERVQGVARMLQIESLLGRLPRQLSGGQKQRVALGRAIARNPQVFLMDEPLSNLDAKLRAETRSQIVKLQRQLGTTTIYVTHDQTEAMTMGHRIAVMNAGQIQQVASPLELYNQPANQFVAEFIGAPPMNFLPITFKAPLLMSQPPFRLTLPEQWASVLQLYDGHMLTLGIRPEHLKVGAAAPKNLLVQVDLVEALGNDTYLSATLIEGDLAGTTLQVRIEPERQVQVRDRIWLSIAVDKLHLFDPDSGSAIRPEVN